jgi:RimJ/RimL family protein N-acetyltransferase
MTDENGSEELDSDGICDLVQDCMETVADARLKPCCDPVTVKRLLLRAPNASDTQQIAELANNSNVAAQTSNMPHPYGTEDAHEWISAATDNRGDRCAYVIVLKPDSDISSRNEAGEQIIGACSFGTPSAGYEGFEIGYWLGEAYWGQGHAAEACHALIDHIFGKTLACSVWATCRVTNARGRRVIEKCGFQFRETAMVHSVALNGMQPVERYVLDRGNWESLKAWGRDDV